MGYFGEQAFDSCLRPAPGTIQARIRFENLQSGKGLKRHMWRMQRISDGQNLVLSISGRIEGDELFELQRALVSLETGHHSIELDLQGVQLVDQEVVTFLACLEVGGTALRNCPPYIREWIKRERKTPDT